MRTRLSLGLAFAMSLAALCSATPQAPLISPLHPLPGDALVGLASGDQQTPSIARGANQSFVVWADRRGSLFSNSGSAESGLDIVGVRLDSTGQRIETVPIALSIAPGADTSPQVAWNGQSWLVAWKSQAPLASIYSSAVVGVRVSGAGQVLDASPLTILAYPGSEIGSMVLGSDGNNWVVAAQGTSGGSANLRVARVSPQGIVLDTNPVTLLPEGQLGMWQLAYAQGSFLLVWSSYFSATNDDIVGRRFDSSLAWQDAAPFVIGRTPSDDRGARVGSSGTQFCVAWQRVLTSVWTDVNCARVTPSGQVLDATPITLNDLFAYGAGPSAAPAWDGVNWFAEWNDFGPRMARISGAGAVLDYNGFLVDSASNSTLVAPQMAGSPAGGVQLAWSDARSGSYEGLDVYTSRVVDATNVGAQVGISSGASAQVTPDLARGATNSLLVFRSETSGARRILATRLDDNGLALDAEPIEIASGLQDSQPAVSWDGSVYLIAWESGSNAAIHARRMASDGALLDAGPIVVGTGTSPEVSGLNGEFLVVYTRAVAYPLQQYTNLVRVRGSDGAVLGAPALINSTYAVNPDVCVLGNRWFVVWQRNYSSSDTHCDVQGAFVEANGVPSATVFVAGSFNNYNHSVSVASSGNEALIAWVFGTQSNATRHIHTRRIRGDGAFLDAGAVTLLPTVAGEQFAPRAAWNGADYVVAFQDLRASTSMLDQPSDLYGARITQGGTLRDPSGFVLEASAASEVGAALVGTGVERVTMASSRLVAATPFGSYRLSTRTIDGVCPSPYSYCTAKTTSLGTLPTIGSVGSTSVAGGSFSLTVTQAIPNTSSLYFYGSAPAALPFKQGWLCSASPLVRAPLVQASGSGSAVAPVSLSPALIGQTRHFQWWMRDPANPDGTGTSLSNALSVTFCP